MDTNKNGARPEWVRAPLKGEREFYSSLHERMLYRCAKMGLIETTLQRMPGKSRGVRLYRLSSILDYIERCRVEEIAKAAGAA